MPPRARVGHAREPARACSPVSRCSPKHFEASELPQALPRVLPTTGRARFALLAIVFVLSSFLDNIAAAMIGGAMAHAVFRGKVHIGYLAAIVAASNAGGSGSVIGDTTTTMMWIDGVSPERRCCTRTSAAVPALARLRHCRGASAAAALRADRQGRLARVPVDWPRVGDRRVHPAPPSRVNVGDEPAAIRELAEHVPVHRRGGLRSRSSSRALAPPRLGAAAGRVKGSVFLLVARPCGVDDAGGAAAAGVLADRASASASSPRSSTTSR